MNHRNLSTAIALCLVAQINSVDAATFQVTNNADSGSGSLRSAITQANNSAGADTITFAIGSGPQTISLLSPLPALGNGGITLDGESQPGSNGTPLIRIDGASAGSNADGLNLVGSGHAIRGLVITRFAQQGIRINSSHNHVIVGNYIGVGHDGVTALGNGDCGVRIVGSGNYIGGTLGSQRNVISGNTNNGVLALGGSGNNLIMNNRIGTDASGAVAVPNGKGITVSSTDNMIGGDGPQYRNIISGNTGTGVSIQGTGNKIFGNYIGLGLNGATAVPNLGAGVAVSGTNTEIGGFGMKGNTISGNGDIGVHIVNVASAIVRGNLIGLNVAGLQAVANQGDGVNIDASSNVLVESNFISGNTGNGVGARGQTPNPEVIELYGNFIGMNVTGNAALPNLGNGVDFYQMDGASKIGAVSKGNVISGNSGHGVFLRESSNINVEANRIGVNMNSDLELGNGLSGIESHASTNLQIGGVTAAQGNVVSNNLGSGMALNYGTTAVVRNNVVGMDGAGFAPMGNGSVGIGVGYGANVVEIGSVVAGNLSSANGGAGIQVIEGTVNIVGNTVGTNFSRDLAYPNEGGIGVDGAADVLIDSNLISGNHYDGIGVGSNLAVVEIVRNKIGTDGTGNGALPNASAMRIFNAAPGLKLGAPGMGNQISGNSRGVTFDEGTSGIIVQGNNFGLNANRSAALGNEQWALGLDGSGHQIGGAGSAGNVFAANGYGIRVSGQQHVIQGNLIGTNAANASGLGNYYGIYLEDADNVLIGGDAATANTIVNNTWYGVRLGTGQRNSVLANIINRNEMYGIDIVPDDGMSPNDPLDADQGPNQRQNFPSVMAATSTGGNLTIDGVLDSKANSEFRIELFQTSACHTSGFGQSESFLGSVSVLTNAQGHATFSTLINNGPSAGFVTATATDALGNTSEFGPCVAVGAPMAGELNFDRQWTMTYEDLGVAEVLVTRSKGLAGTVTVQFTTSNDSAMAGQDYTAVSQTLNFAPGESTKTVSIPLISDGPGESMEDFDIHLTAATGGATLGALKDASVAIYEQDANNVHGSIEDVAVTEPVSGQVAAVFTVTIGTSNVVRTIQYTTEDGSANAGSDYIATSGTLTFQPGQTSNTVSVMVRADAMLEDSEFFTLKLTESDPNFSLLRDTAVGGIANTGGAMILFGDSFED